MKDKSTLREAMRDLGVELSPRSRILGPIHLDAVVKDVARLPSKKNIVYHIHTDQGPLVVKIFRTGNEGRESRVLVEAFQKGIPVPEIYGMAGKAIIMEYVKGPTICDVLNDTLNPVLCVDLGVWFSEFHTAFKAGQRTLVKSDCNLKNFLLSKNGVVGVDFELARLGNPLEDLGEVCSHILDTDPMFVPEKYRLCKVFLDKYQEMTNLRLSKVKSFVVKSLEETSSYRPSQRRVLIGKARELREDALSYPFDEYE
jgi:tRNA A-37 threonylcarbamoyl transferase component Bud32